MPVSNRPLFSPPVLAAVMVLCTLAIWLLNLTAPSSKLPTPNLETWHTTSDIPVTWVKHANWETGDKLEIRLVFRSEEHDANLVQTTLAMLMSNSLPLSTASINQRLSPLAAKVSSYYDHESQVIGLTLSNQSQYLNPTLALVTNWLKQPDFKLRTFEQWQRQQQNAQASKHALVNTLFDTQHSMEQVISLKDIQDYYYQLQKSATHIYIVGHLSDQVRPSVEEALNQISLGYQLEDHKKATLDEIKASHVTQLNKQASSQLWQSRSAIALTPMTSVKEWISLQIWGADLVSTLNSQADIDFVQLGLTLSALQPWAGWNIQYAEQLIIDSPQSAEEQTGARFSANSFIHRDNIPSINDRARFADLFSRFKDQLGQQAQSSTWWAYMATQVVHEQGSVPLEDFIESYKEAIDTFTIDDYQNIIEPLIKADSYQEIQTYQ
ncbi:insulinase family protein [Marinomonas sp. C2222]|uniref:Insulinase family protein n=1 Tax=Marinomonas sargassi TaxID=2984494 RepID=A0ABT2YQG5_9GAMM|nr:insulinase family protein [Marinomonas sargassi]MCV2402120.1 insulinase family protein [Marinomonas sargassi]